MEVITRMIDEDTARKVLAAALSRGGDFAEVFAERRVVYNLRLEEGRIEENTSGYEVGAEVRVINGESVAYAYTNDLDPSALEETARVAAASSRGGSTVTVSLERPLRSLSSPREHVASLDISSFPREKKIELLRRADQAAREAGGRPAGGSGCQGPGGGGEGRQDARAPGGAGGGGQGRRDTDRT